MLICSECSWLYGANGGKLSSCRRSSSQSSKCSIRGHEGPTANLKKLDLGSSRSMQTMGTRRCITGYTRFWKKFLSMPDDVTMRSAGSDAKTVGWVTVEEGCQ
uniref:Uncharacterized protein n=1 Tax=Ditylenchus dipsaci TaxID=166011 RepID=A0A915D394_9BILA